MLEAETEEAGPPGALASSTVGDRAASCIVDGPEAKVALKILVVDDDEGVLRTVSRVLVRAGHSVHAASTPQEALSLVAEIEPDVCITDVIMEGLDGYEFCSRLLAMPGLEDTPVIVVTAFGGERVDLEVGLGVIESHASVHRYVVTGGPAHFAEENLRGLAEARADGKRSRDQVRRCHSAGHIRAS